LSDANQASGYPATDINNEIVSEYYNEFISRADMISKLTANEAVGFKFYQINDAATGTRIIQVIADSNITLYALGIDVQTGETGDYDINTDVFTPIVVSGTPTLQQVTTAGFTTSVGVTVDNGAGESIDIKHDLINITNALGSVATITSPTLTTATTFELPDKASPQTFAMIEDIGGLDLEVNGTPNVNQTLLNLIEGVNIDIADNGTGGVTITSLADRYSTSSISTNDIDNGNGKVFIVDANLAYIPLQEVLIVNAPTKHMHGTVVSYSGTTLTVDINSHTGGGTFSSWVINLDGTPVDAITGVGTVNEIAYFTSGQVIASLPVATYPSLTELSYVKGVGSQVVGTTDTNTLTNKRITARTGTVASAATPTINTDNVDYYSITALAAAITSFTTNLSGTPTIGQTLWISIKDNGTARAIAWGASFEASTIALPTTTVISTRLDVAFIWNEATSVWRCVGVA
jgi:hypothetical protein